MAKISVIVPCYNVEKYLEECLDSIVNQTFTDIEIICINDGSTDSTNRILDIYSNNDSRIKIITQTNKGLSASRNIGIENSNGEYILFIDSDDYLELTAFEEIYNIAKKKQLDILIFKLINFDDVTREKMEDKYFTMEYLKEMVGDNIFDFKDTGSEIFTISVTAPGKLFKKELIENMRFPEGYIFEDNPFFTEAMFKAKKAYFYDEFLYNRRIRADSITQSSSDKFSDWIEIFNMVIDIAKSFGYFEQYSTKIFEKKMFSTYKYFKATDFNYRDVFFEKMKTDFISHKTEYESLEIFDEVHEKALLIFNLGMECESPQEFIFKMSNFENEKEIEELNKFINLVLTSNSWKITKPLRKLQKTLKGAVN